MLVCTTALVWTDIREMASTVEVKEFFTTGNNCGYTPLFVCLFVFMGSEIKVKPVLNSHNFHLSAPSPTPFQSDASPSYFYPSAFCRVVLTSRWAFVHTFEEGRVSRSTTTNKVKVRARMQYRNHETTGPVFTNSETVQRYALQRVIEQIEALFRGAQWIQMEFFKPCFYRFVVIMWSNFLFSETEETVGATGGWKG